MKPQRSIMVEPKAPRGLDAAAQDDENYLRQKQLDESRILQAERERAQHDQIGTLLGSNFYSTDKTWSFLTQNGYQHRVSRWYPVLNTAVDIFASIDDQVKKEIEFKRLAFKKNGIRYGALDYSMSLDALIPQTGIPTKGA